MPKSDREFDRSAGRSWPASIFNISCDVPPRIAIHCSPRLVNRNSRGGPLFSSGERTLAALMASTTTQAGVRDRLSAHRSAKSARREADLWLDSSDPQIQV